MIERYEVDSMIDNVRNDARYYAEEESRLVKYDLENQLTSLHRMLREEFAELQNTITHLSDRVSELEDSTK